MDQLKFSWNKWWLVTEKKVSFLLGNRYAGWQTPPTVIRWKRMVHRGDMPYFNLESSVASSTNLHEMDGGEAMNEMKYGKGSSSLYGKNMDDAANSWVASGKILDEIFSAHPKDDCSLISNTLAFSSSRPPSLKRSRQWLAFFATTINVDYVTGPNMFGNLWRHIENHDGVYLNWFKSFLNLFFLLVQNN